MTPDYSFQADVIAEAGAAARRRREGVAGVADRQRQSDY